MRRTSLTLFTRVVACIAACTTHRVPAQPQPGYPITADKAELSLQQMAAMSAAQSPEISLKASQTQNELLLTFGPVDLPMDMPNMTMTMPEYPPRWITIPDDAWLHGYWVELVDKNGAPVPSSTLHHVNVIATQQRELFSPIMLRIAAASGETEPVSLPRLLGMDAHKGDTLLVRAMLHNPTTKAYQGVRILVHFPLTKRTSTFGSLRVQPFYLDVTPPAAPHAFDLPPGHSERYWDSKPAVHARLVGFSGHVHKFASVLRFEDRTSGKVIWETHPDTTAAGEVKAIPVKRFLATFGAKLDPTHTYRLTVTYDNPTNKVIVDGGMGTLGGVVYVDGDTRWPAVDARDPEYRMDVRAMWRP